MEKIPVLMTTCGNSRNYNTLIGIVKQHLIHHNFDMEIAIPLILENICRVFEFSMLNPEKAMLLYYLVIQPLNLQMDIIPCLNCTGKYDFILYYGARKYYSQMYKFFNHK